MWAPRRFVVLYLNRREKMKTFLLQFGIVFASSPVWASSFWINSSVGVDTSNCGKNHGTQACRTYNFLMSQGCDSNGCLDNIQTELNTINTNPKLNFECVNSGTTCTGTGVHSGRIAIGFDGQANSILTVQCTDGAGTYAPLNCKITGGTPGVVIFGMNPSGGDDTASYIRFKGFEISGFTQGGVRFRNATSAGPTHHISFRDNRVDGGTTATEDLFQAVAGTNFITYTNNIITNCAPGGTWGCAAFQQPNNNLAAIGNHLGPRRDFPGPYNGGAGSNLDCNTWQGTTRGLLDGNECFKTADGLDNGMLDSSKIQDLIIRFNDLHDVYGNPNTYGSRLAKVSGDAGSSTPTGAMIFYKNIFRHTNSSYWGGAIWVTELGKDIEYWYNTMYGAEFMYNDNTIDYFSIGSQQANVPSFYNIFDGTAVGNPSGACQLVANKLCPIMVTGYPACTSSACKWTGNRLWFAERGPTAPCISYNLTSGTMDTFTCDLKKVGGGPDFNLTGSNSGNARANPGFKNRGGPNVADYQLTSASTEYINKGGSFCKAATNQATPSNTVTVTCNGNFSDPRKYFPQPSDFYDVSNGDCKNTGTRSGDSSNPGCFDFQIEGCGIRQIVSMTANSITFSGGTCTWAQNAMVHIPWTGSAPDIGAMEAPSKPRPMPPVPKGIK